MVALCLMGHMTAHYTLYYSAGYQHKREMKFMLGTTTSLAPKGVLLPNCTADCLLNTVTLRASMRGIEGELSTSYPLVRKGGFVANGVMGRLTAH